MKFCNSVVLSELRIILLAEIARVCSIRFPPWVHDNLDVVLIFVCLVADRIMPLM